MDQLQPEGSSKKLEYLNKFHPVCLQTALKNKNEQDCLFQDNQFPRKWKTLNETLVKHWNTETQKFSISHWKDFQSLTLIVKRESHVKLKQLLHKIAIQMKNATHLTFNFNQYSSITSIGLESLGNILSSNFLKLQNLSLSFNLYQQGLLQQVQSSIKKIVPNLPKLNQFHLHLKKDIDTESKDFINFVKKTCQFLSGISKLKNCSLIFNQFEKITLQDIQEILSHLFESTNHTNLSISFRKFPRINSQQDLEPFLESIYNKIPNIPIITSSNNPAFGKYNQDPSPFKVFLTQTQNQIQNQKDQNLQPQFIGLTIIFKNNHPKIIREYRLDEYALSQYTKTSPGCSRIGRKRRMKIHQDLDLYQADDNQLLYQHSLSISLDGCFDVNDEAIQKLGYDVSVFSPHLKSLSFQFENTRFVRITDIGPAYFIFGICQQQALSLENLSLKFNELYDLTEEGIQIVGMEICESLKNLQHLSLSFQKCNKITIEGLNFLIEDICEHLINLKSLSLDFRNNGDHLMTIKDQIIQDVKKALPNLIDLSILL